MATHDDFTRMSIDIPSKEHRRLKAIAALRGVSMKQIILECLSKEIYSDNVPNEVTEKTFCESDENKHVNVYKDLNALRSHLDI